MTARSPLLPWAVVLLCAGTLAACGDGADGGGDGSEPQPKPLSGEKDPAATRVAQDYVDAYYKKDAEQVCRLVAASVRQALEEEDGCVETVQTSFAAAFRQKLRAQRSFVTGEEAIVTFRDAPRQVKLTREAGRWRVIDGGA